MGEEIIYYPLTHPQKAIWYTEKIHPGTSISNVAGTLKIKGKVDFGILEKAINIVVEQNDGLRLRMLEDGSEPKQYVSEYKPFKIDYIDFSRAKSIEELYKWDEEQTRVPFKLTDSDLFYFVLVKISEDEGGFYIKLHHLISDAWTMSLVANQVMENYHNLKENIEILHKNKPSYIDYIETEKEYTSSDKYQRDKEYWHERFNNFDELTVLKTRTTSEVNTRTRRKTFVTPTKFNQKLYSYCKEHKVSIFSMFLSGLTLYINRVTGKEDIILGTVILNRANHTEKSTMGMYISTVPLRVSVNDTLNFDTFEKNVSKDMLGVLRHQKYPYDVLLKEMREKYKMTDNLYDIVLSYQNAKYSKDTHAEEYEVRWHSPGYQANSISVHINDREDEGNLIIDYDYHTDLYHAKEIEFIHQHIINILWHALDNPAKEVRYLDMLSERERHKILYEFNDTKADYPKDKTIHQLFEEQVLKGPDNVALVFEEKTMTYRELNEKANQLARLLRERAVKPDKIVGIMVNRSFEMIVGILAVLKAGGCYLPIDPDYPEDRIKYMLEDSSADILLTQTHLKNNVNFNGEMICINEDGVYEGDENNPENMNGPNDLAYVIYTSGSTGKPKGVMIEHRNVVNYITGVSNTIDFSSNKTIISVTTISFDIFVTESLVPLTKGQKVVIANEDEQRVPELLNKSIIKNNIQMIQTTPSRMQLLLMNKETEECFKKFTDIMIGGEVFPKTILEKVKKLSSAKIYNMYGPTETTVWSTIKELTDSEEIDVGRPIANTSVYILDKNYNPVPIGMAGELYIGGEGVTRGYYKRRDITKDRFISNPFIKGQKIYKTGDIARWYPQGDIEHLGRVDNQVKIRGYRIELEEIEIELTKHEDIKEAVVIDRMDKYNNKYLCAYIVTKNRISVSKIREFLLNELPNYMIPSYFIEIDDMPLTPNGKINRKALPEPTSGLIAEHEYVAPTNEIEGKLCKIWAEVLHIDKVGTTDNFFDMGGDSLDVADIISRTNKDCNQIITFRELYKYPTVKQISSFINLPNINLNEKEYENLVLIRQGNDNKNLFLIHAGSGEIDVYVKVCYNLNKGLTCWGIKADRLKESSPYNITIEEIAEKYIEKIKTVQPKGPYYLGGWCIGGTIAIEMSRQLESIGDKVAMVSLFNTIAPQVWNDIEKFSVSTELNLVGQWIENKGIINSLSRFNDVEYFWQYIINNVQELKLIPEKIKPHIPEDIAKAIPNFDDSDIYNLFYYINIIRTLHIARASYFPRNKIKAQVYLFEALDDNIIADKKNNEQLWTKYCENNLQIISNKGNHFTMFDNLNIINLSTKLSDILNSCERR